MEARYSVINLYILKSIDGSPDLPKYLTFVETNDESTFDYLIRALKMLSIESIRIDSAPRIILAFGSEFHPDKFFNEVCL